MRTTLATIGGLVVATMGAYSITEESYKLPFMVAILTVWIVIEWRRKALPEAWILGLAAMGYIVGNRGFAQLTLISNFPLLPAEAALGLAGLGILVRSLIQKQSLVRKDPLNIAILVWFAYATVRLPVDFKAFGFVAVRDYALAYYAGFFFLSQFLAEYETSRVLLRKIVTISFFALPIAFIANRIAPDFFLNTLTWNGNPVIYHKSDLIAGSLACGSFWFWSRFELDGRKIWLVPSALSLLLIATTESPRAAMVAVAVVTVAWLLARRFRLIRFQIAVVVVGLVVSVPVEMTLGTPFEQTKAYGMYERSRSIVDWTGSHTYQSADAVSTGDNNQFRIVWWKSVYEETVSQNPLFGLGFGYDLAARFLADYDWLSVEEEFSTRSPHSVIMTNFGRLGVVGLVLFLAIGAAAVWSARRSFRDKDFEAMEWWSVVGVLGISACFGVVLEGPMGAVVFWIALGVAHEQAGHPAAKTEPEAHDALPKDSESVSSLAT